MAAPRNWDRLSDRQRNRYIRRGVTQEYYESGGSLKEARGHGRTPERPERAARNPERYNAYLSRKAMRVITPDGVVMLGAMSKADRSKSAKHANAVRAYVQRDSVEGLFGNQSQFTSLRQRLAPGSDLTNFDGETVSGYDVEAGGWKTVEFQTDPSKLTALAVTGQLNFDQVYRETT